MTARRYEISLRVLKNIIQGEINTNKIPNYCKRQDLLCNHSNGDLFTCENNVIFLCESSTGISLVFI